MGFLGSQAVILCLVSAAICYLLLCQVSQCNSSSITLSGINHSGNQQVTQIQVSVMTEGGEENKEGGRKERDGEEEYIDSREAGNEI